MHRSAHGVICGVFIEWPVPQPRAVQWQHHCEMHGKVCSAARQGLVRTCLLGLHALRCDTRGVRLGAQQQMKVAMLQHRIVRASGAASVSLQSCLWLSVALQCLRSVRLDFAPAGFHRRCEHPCKAQRPRPLSFFAALLARAWWVQFVSCAGRIRASSANMQSARWGVERCACRAVW